MQAGKVVRRFSAKDGRQVMLRTLRWEDLDDCIELINSLVAEGANIAKNDKVTREEEVEWLAGALSRMERGEKFYLVAEVDGKVVGNSEIGRRLGGYDKHVGSIGIAIKKGFRDVGVGTEMMKALIKQGREMGLKVLTLTAFANNKRAIHVYEKLGFQQTGQIPKKFFKRGKFIDELIMTLILT
jgi:RimJ/RimL family protein N-acetyltransferase